MHHYCMYPNESYFFAYTRYAPLCRAASAERLFTHVD